MIGEFFGVQHLRFLDEAADLEQEVADDAAASGGLQGLIDFAGRPPSGMGGAIFGQHVVGILVAEQTAKFLEVNVDVVARTILGQSNAVAIQNLPRIAGTRTMRRDCSWRSAR